MRKHIKKWKEKGQQAVKAGKALLSKFVAGPVGKLSVGFLIVVFVLLGTSFGWQCGENGWNCSLGYKPPDPNDVRRIIKSETVSHPILKHRTDGAVLKK